jgi:protocatechuate 3,4-dioxygenase beta subunit
MILQLIFAAALVAVAVADHDELSPARHAVLQVRRLSASKRFVEEVNVSAVVVAPFTTEGPYFATLSDYANDANMTAAAVANNRTTVLNGVPMQLTINVYDVVGTTGTELANATVFLWHCDTIGVYGAVSLSQNPSNQQDTLGQKWLRSQQPTDASGKVVFNTVVPGWYTGRTMHFHVRVRLPSAASDTTFVITTQLFFDDAVQAHLKSVAPYSQHTATYTTLATDMIATQAATSVGTGLVLQLAGDYKTGFTASFALGIDKTATRAPGGMMMMGGGGMPPNRTTGSSASTSSTTSAAGTASDTAAVADSTTTTVAGSTDATGDANTLPIAIVSIAIALLATILL